MPYLDGSMYASVWVSNIKARRNQKTSTYNFSCVQMQLAHVRSRSYRNIPEITNTFQKLPKHSRSFRHIPETTETFQKLPIHIPEATETFQKLPTHSRNYRNIPEATVAETSEAKYRSVPETTEALQKLPKYFREAPETLKKVPKHPRREKLLLPPPPCPGAYIYFYALPPVWHPLFIPLPPCT